MVFTSGVGRRMDNMKKLGKEIRAKKQQKIVEKENRLTEQAEANYIAEQEAKEKRQAEGLGLLVVAVPSQSDEEIEKKKKSQGLGAVITGANTTLG